MFTRRSISALFATAALLLTTHAAPALAADAPVAQPPQYAVLSLIGGGLNLVFATDKTTGSRLDNSARQTIELPGKPFDVAAMKQIQTSLQAVAPQREVALFNGAPSAVAAAPGSLVKDGKLQLSEPLLAALRSSGATQLLMVTRHRQEAHIQMYQQEVGQGRLEGIGFYVDQITTVTDRTSRETSVGFLAPFVNLQLTLIDLATARVVTEQTMSVSAPYLAPDGTRGSSVWNALSPEKKLSILQAMIAHEMKRAMDTVLARS